MLNSALRIYHRPINKKAPRPAEFEDVALRKKLKDYSISLAPISGALLPDQRMCNAICEIIATAINTQPPYTPYVLACYRSNPLVVSATDHVRALSSFGRKMKNFRTAQSLSSHQFLLTLCHR